MESDKDLQNQRSTALLTGDWAKLHELDKAKDKSAEEKKAQKNRRKQ